MRLSLNAWTRFFARYGFTLRDNERRPRTRRQLACESLESRDLLAVDVFIYPSDSNAAEAADNPGQFTVFRSGSTTQALVVNYSIGGTAINGVDYNTAASLTGSVTIEAGQSTATIDILPYNDTDPEDSETVLLTLTSGDYTPGYSSSATVTIADNDPPTVSITASDPDAAEAGQATGEFTISRNGPTTQSLTVWYSIAGSAINGVDYNTANSLTGSLVIGVGQSSATITITPHNDTDPEVNETVLLTLQSAASWATQYLGAGASATVTIADNDPPTVIIFPSDPTSTEAAGNPGQFTVSRNGPTAQALVVNYSIAGTADNGVDYNYGSPLTGSVTIEANQSSAYIDITPYDDEIDEDAETVILTLNSDATYIAGYSSSATVTIADNDLPTVSITASGTPRETGQTTSQFIISRQAATTESVTVYFTPIGGTAATNGDDYATFANSVTIQANQTSATITLTPDDDDDNDDSETVILTISTTSTYNTGSPATATVTIEDNDLPPSVTLDVGENSALHTFVGSVPRFDPGFGGTFTFTITAGNLDVDGDAANVFAIDPSGDITVNDPTELDFEENDEYTLTVEVSNGSVTRTTTVTVFVNDVNEAPDFSPPNDVYTVRMGRNQMEGKEIFDTGGRRVATATDDDGDTLTFSIVNGDTDIFQINASTGMLSLKVDGVEVPEDRYDLTIRASDGYAFTDATVEITVVDAVGMVADTHAIEGGTDVIIVTFKRFSYDPSLDDLDFTFDVSWTRGVNGVGIADRDDFVSTADRGSIDSESLTFAANETEKTFTLSAASDITREGIETFIIQVLDGANDTYIAVLRSSDVEDKKLDDIDVFGSLRFHALDGITLYAKQNLALDAVDDVDLDGVVENGDDLDHDNPGIHVNDVNQGGHGDCYFLAAVAAVVTEGWEHIENLITDHGNNSYTVRLWDGTNWVDHTIDFSLERGYDMAELTGDVNAVGHAEIWPILLEMAYAEANGGYEAIASGHADIAYLALTGQGGIRISTIGDTDEEILIEINNQRGAGNQVVFSTRSELPAHAGAVTGHPAQNVLFANHAYLVTDYFGIDTDADSYEDTYFYRLYNPCTF